MLRVAATPNQPPPRIVLSWYGAWPARGVTVGDLFAVENLSRALTQSGVPHGVISAFAMSVSAPILADFRQVPPTNVIVHICGPLMPVDPLRFMLARAERKVAVGVSVLRRFDAFNATFDAIVARDGRQPETFDLALARFAGAPPPASANAAGGPVVGLCLRGKQREYIRAVFDEKAAALLHDAAASRSGVIHRINTVLREDNPEAKIVAQFRGCDLVATTRMHGALLALAFGKPVVAVDQVEGGAKVTSLLTRIGWPLVFPGASVTQGEIAVAFQRALSPEIRPVVERCRAEAIRLSVAAVDTSVKAIVALAGQTFSAEAGHRRHAD